MTFVSPGVLALAGRLWYSEVSTRRELEEPLERTEDSG